MAVAVAVAAMGAVIGATAVVGKARAGAMQQQPEQLGQQPQHTVRCVTSKDRHRSAHKERTMGTFGKCMRTPAMPKGGMRSTECHAENFPSVHTRAARSVYTYLL